MIQNAIISGKKLPTLTTPGSASDLLSGKQLIDQDGNILDGTLVAPRLITTVSALSITSDGNIYLTLNSFPEDFNGDWYISGYTAVPEYSVKPFCLVINEPVQWGPGFGRGMLKYTTSGGYMATTVSYDVSAKQLVFSGTTNLLSVNYSASSVTTGSFTFWDQAVTIS